MAARSAAGIQDELERAHAAGRVHGAYLFHGPDGTGKRATALWLAGLLLGRLRGAADEPWHPDLHVVDPEGGPLRIEPVRVLQRGLSLVANEGGHRVALLFGVERMRTEAANALLKTLEEPPPQTTLVLVTSAPDALLPTVRSRTTEYRFVPTPPAELEAALREQGLADSDAWLAAALGGGSAEAALAWAEDHLERARSLLDAIVELPHGSSSDVLDFAESFRGRRDARDHAELFLDVHDALARREIEIASRSGDADSVERWLLRAEAGLRARREMIVRNLNPQLVVENLALDLRD